MLAVFLLKVLNGMGSRDKLRDPNSFLIFGPRSTDSTEWTVNEWVAS